MDQQCYDFMKWYMTTGNESDYDWGDMSLRFLDIKSADAFEDVELFCSKFMTLSFAPNLTLLKIKLLIDVLNLVKLREEHADKLPNEIMDQIEQQAVRSPITKEARHILEAGDHTEIQALGPNGDPLLIAELKKQVKALHASTNTKNKFYWLALLNTGTVPPHRPEIYSYGTKEEVVLVLQWTYYAWQETPGAFEIIRAINKGTFD